jgi:hypothetical protein
MKMAQETPCVAVLNKQKCHFLFLCFAKSKNRCAEQVLPTRVGASEKEEEVRKW